MLPWGQGSGSTQVKLHGVKRGDTLCPPSKKGMTGEQNKTKYLSIICTSDPVAVNDIVRIQIQIYKAP